MLAVSREGYQESHLNLRLLAMPEGRRMIYDPFLYIERIGEVFPKCAAQLDRAQVLGAVWECKAVNRLLQLKGALTFRLKALNKEKLRV